LTALAGPAGAQSTEAERIAANRVLLDQYVAMKNARDASRTADIYTDTYIENTGRSPSGLAALTDNWKAQFQAMPDMKVTLDDAVITSEKIVARVTYTATHTVPFFGGIPPTGKAFKLGTIDIWRVSGGKLAEHWDQVDFAGLQRQLTAK
jgi:predicted ester cyclase